ncbi:MAG: 50S ribosomal protein L22 [Alphaproteobacteria bacterium]|nr:50S ribosomal protein L22 [Alphaproteobacteria bacterium]
MGKPKTERRLGDDTAEARGRVIRTSARKLNLVAASIRGLSASDAITALNFTKRRIAIDVKKVLQAAIANAENNHNLDVDKLYVAEASVGRSFVMHRFHTRGRGRSAAIQKPFSNLTVIVRERKEEEKKKKTASAKGKASGKAKTPAAEAKPAETEQAGT